jgi:hypothetical protein
MLRAGLVLGVIFWVGLASMCVKTAVSKRQYGYLMAALLFYFVALAYGMLAAFL